jgi:hypothetical protein
MKRSLLGSLYRSGIKSFVRDPIFLLASLASFFLILLLQFGFSLISDFIFTTTGFNLDNYYTIVAITLISAIPILFGIACGLMFLYKTDLHFLQLIDVTPAGKRNYMIIKRMIGPAFITFIMLLFSFILTNPVPSEGWLRTLFVSSMLSIQCPFVFLFIGSLGGSKVRALVLSNLYGIFLIAVPLGLLLHHPWNYFAFFSPLYWISWALVSSNPFESLVYGTISMIITIGFILIFFRRFLRKYAN